MTAYENMAAFLESQLDFIFFFYGLAFIVLGIVCFAIEKMQGTEAHWAVLGAFAAVHGVGEWLDLVALVAGDSPLFSIFRVALMTLSFVFILEFARLNGPISGLRMPGRWIHALLLGLVAIGFLWEGPGVAGAFARYTFGFLGAVGTSLVFVGYAGRRSGAARTLALFTASCFFLYALAAGVVVPAAPIWPATVINHTKFLNVTGVPIQLIRGTLACVLAFSIGAMWGRMLSAEISSELYTAYLRKQFLSTIAAMALILTGGWALTEFLGGLYRQNVERTAFGDIDLLTGRFTGETKIVDGMVKVLARTGTVISLASGDRRSDWSDAKTSLNLNIEASEASSGYVLDISGTPILAHEDPKEDKSLLKNHLKALFDAALAGRPGRSFVVDADGLRFRYETSMPIVSEKGSVVGAIVLSKSLGRLEDDLDNFGRPYFLVDPDGIVVLSNRRESLFSTLWPISTQRDGNARPAYVTKAARPLMVSELTGGKWTVFAGKREFVLRRFIDNSPWSVVIAMPTETIFASRLLGIIVTLLMAVMTLIYFAGRNHGTRESVRMDRQHKLQQLARDLRYQATTDSLTGLSNRFKFDESLASEMLRSMRYQSPLTLILFDIDHFKRVNDVFGHQAGDEVLVRLSKVLARSIRESDVLARWGGEEFVILAPGLDCVEAYRAALKLAVSIEQLVFTNVGNITCSFGVAEFSNGETAEGLIDRADTALYRAKMSGRNRVEMSPPPAAAGGGAKSVA